MNPEVFCKHCPCGPKATMDGEGAQQVWRKRRGANPGYLVVGGSFQGTRHEVLEVVVGHLVQVSSCHCARAATQVRQ
jgi:hypothetical protein